ncbi:MAG: hydrogenase maturation nickel metallochaperone HypA, partial [Deltaproteobacteria bacterium]|nr:hydrogenase maturation nickel metallochaperone HypA [Deltaproteobacteria bacterium]MCE5262984.1 hydrogenase maturation nickel metallochaperone HypA [Deltaproteobacteria bacterium]
MHELSVTEAILKIVLKHAEANSVRQVVAIHLRIGKMSDLQDEWLQS